MRNTQNWADDQRSRNVMMDWQRQERIQKWLKSEDAIYGDYNGEIDSEELEALLLAFEHYLNKCEAERQKR